jgi:hypothetical protein
MATPLVVDVITVASATTNIALNAFVAAIATLQAAAAASCEGTVGAVVAASASVGTTVGDTAATCPHPLVGLPFYTVSVSAPASPTTGTVGPWSAVATIGAPTGIAVGALIGTVVGTASPMATAAIAGAPAGTATGAHPWPEPHIGRRCMPSLRHPVWLSDVAGGPCRKGWHWHTCLAVLLRPVHGRSPILVNIRLLHDTPVWLSGAAGGTLIHTAFATAVTTVIVVLQGVGPVVPRRLPQLDGARSHHARDRLGGRLRRH